MTALCPECAHLIYGYPPCKHVFDDVGNCSRCGWNQSRSEYILKLLTQVRSPT